MRGTMDEGNTYQLGLRPEEGTPGHVLEVIDMQVDFVDGALGTDEVASIVDAVCRRIDECDAGTQVVVTKDTHGKDYMETQEGRNLPVPHCQVGTDGWMLDSEVELAMERYERRTGRKVAVYFKSTFGSTALARDLAECAKVNEIRGIEVIGLCTDICVVSNAMLAKAFLPETEVSVRAGCCAGVTPESHEAALATMASCQIRVIRPEED